MENFDLAIVGQGVLPGLVALLVRSARKDARILLLTADDEAGGRGLELMMVQHLAKPVRDVLDPAIVSEWPAYYRLRSGTRTRNDERVALLDPVQIWLELNQLAHPPTIVTKCGEVECVGHSLHWSAGAAICNEAIDLRPWTSGLADTHIVAIEASARLDLPVVSDPASSLDAEPGDILHWIPLGDNRMAVRHWPPAEGRGTNPGVAVDDPLMNNAKIYQLLNGIVEE
ncbi:MAG: hypothetical protein KGL48_00225 [Sphingomonadales bacterium]|nr:hypothetical protein [Sphingomonadales bacterium]MDE2569542.1 hypothetical protein [Sphingomonadales bacterium]